ncbi:hypothetical protein PGO_094300 [Plasmodium gonderi]|uniref:Protein YIPF n=1 Tax=Plasmodium gonderi TaxID=77519 RepID=A0A1Y1JFB5_PLAGO|nr:hypothetical protein PGO_094300 [Plasmodium gonderi]GAW81229.1 hypothetical protein PGO_094300 [Plasmodium gonderi]
MDTTVVHLGNYEFVMDEPVKDTVVRDAKSIYKKILHICFHQYDDDNTLKKWDLWGSFIVYITLSIIIFLDNEVSDKKNTFAFFFFFFMVGHILVSLNLSLLHTKIISHFPIYMILLVHLYTYLTFHLQFRHFFQLFCIISYSQFPLVFSAFVNLFISCRMIRLLFSICAVIWSTYNCILILTKFIKKNRFGICFFPICLLQFFVATFLLIK